MIRVASAILLGLLIWPGAAPAVTVGQIDTFEDGTTQNWIINLLGMGAPPPETIPTNVATGGPAGTGDNYLRLQSTGTGGAGGRLVAMNPAQWGGNYLAAGVSAITMDVNNLGSTELILRLLFEDPVLGPPENIAVSTTGVSIPAGSGWMHIVLPISPAHLTAVEGDVVAALTNTTIIRLFHSTTAGFPPAPISAVLGVDNIAAVPEPSTMLLLGVGLAVVLGGRLRRVRV